jgi:toxin YoeB
LRVHLTDNGWDDYRYWFNHDQVLAGRINELIENARRMPLKGLGKPEPLMVIWWFLVATHHR